MTWTTTMDRERLAAFVDGELSPEEAAAVVLHLADHPQDQAYVDDLMAANAALAKVYGAALDEPVPDRIRETIMGQAPAATVVPFRRPAAGPVRSRVVWAAGMALAAGLAVAVFLPAMDAAPIMAPGPLAADSALVPVLDRVASGTPHTLGDGVEAMILATVPTNAGHCREIEVIDSAASRLTVGLACTQGRGWTVEVVLVENLADAVDDEGFGTASGNEAQAFTPFLDRIGAGPVMTADEEAVAMAGGWAR